ncbi:MAG: TVP38/TMEM64 family protein, partial [Akkermansiaceae bacterium]|nr:TVP38/TMEM64 family protein [Akkermansiaceae bacterium]
ALGWLDGLASRLKDWTLQALGSIEGLDPVHAGVVFIGLYIAATVLFVPGLLITMAAGVLFGVLKGTLVVSLASVVGASLAFLIGRHLARDRIARKIEGHPRFEAVDEAVAADGARIVFLLRLSPVFPFNLLNYALGLTRIPFWHYVGASWIGMLPGTVMYVYLGSLAGSLAGLAAGGQEKTPAQWVLYGLGLAATVIVTVYVTRIAKRALNRELDDPPGASQPAA